MKRLEETIAIGLNCLEAGIETKAEVKDKIMQAARSERRAEITISIDLLKYLSDKYNLVATIDDKSNQIKYFKEGA